MAGGNDHCDHCGKAATKQCAGCNNIKYCDQDCQKNDRPLHKYLCKTYADFATPPAANLRRVIVLPQFSIKPHFAWMKVEIEEEHVGYEEHEISRDDVWDVAHHESKPGKENTKYEGVFGPYALPARGAPSHRVVLGKLGGGERADHSIHVVRDPSSVVTMNFNQCIMHLSGGRAVKADLRARGDWAIYARGKVTSSRFFYHAQCSDLTLGINGTIDLEENFVALEKEAAARDGKQLLNYDNVAVMAKFSASNAPIPDTMRRLFRSGMMFDKEERDQKEQEQADKEAS